MLKLLTIMFVGKKKRKAVPFCLWFSSSFNIADQQSMTDGWMNDFGVRVSNNILSSFLPLRVSNIISLYKIHSYKNQTKQSVLNFIFTVKKCVHSLKFSRNVFTA